MTQYYGPTVASLDYNTTFNGSIVKFDIPNQELNLSEQIENIQIPTVAYNGYCTNDDYKYCTGTYELPCYYPPSNINLQYPTQWFSTLPYQEPEKTVPITLEELAKAIKQGIEEYKKVETVKVPAEKETHQPKLITGSKAYLLALKKAVEEALKQDDGEGKYQEFGDIKAVKVERE